MLFIFLEAGIGYASFGARGYWDRDTFTCILLLISIPIEIIGLTGLISFVVVEIIRSLRFLRPIFVIHRLKVKVDTIHLIFAVDVHHDALFSLHYC